VGKKQPKYMGNFCNFQKAAQSKQSPKRQKSANLVTLNAKSNFVGSDNKDVAESL
jgi:hypothetical protein